MANDMPIALRRTPRRSGGVRLGLNASTPAQGSARHGTASKASTTSKQKKRPRSSDSNSIIVVLGSEAEPFTPPSSGNHRSTHRAIPSTKRRKYSTQTPSQSKNDESHLLDYSNACNATPGSNEIRIVPLRAILDDRVKRRIRRNGLSEEMSIIYNERKHRAKRSIEEIARLRDQLTTKEAENEMLREQSSLLQDTGRVQELQKEISELKQRMDNNDLHNDDWDMAAGDGFSDGGSLASTDDLFFRDDTTVEVEDGSNSASAKPYIDAISTLTPPNTSPTKPSTPDSTRSFLRSTHCDVGVQAEMGVADEESLETELTTLRGDLVSTQKALEAQVKLKLKLQDQLSSVERMNVGRGPDPDHQLQMDIMLQTLADKTTAIAVINESLASLGSSGSEASCVVSTLKEAFQSARQELEEMCLDGQSLPVSPTGTEILELMLQRLRDSAVQVKEYERSLEDYCIREEQLLQQLNDRVEAMGTLSGKLRQKDDHIFKLEANMERSEVILEGCRKSLGDARRTIFEKDAELTEMEENLRSMVSVTADLQAQLAQVHVDREVDMLARKSKHKDQIALRDGKVLELHKDITSLKEALQQAQDSISQLRADKKQLREHADRDKKTARDMVTSLRTQLLQSLQMSEEFLA